MGMKKKQENILFQQHYDQTLALKYNYSLKEKVFSFVSFADLLKVRWPFLGWRKLDFGELHFHDG